MQIPTFSKVKSSLKFSCYKTSPVLHPMGIAHQPNNVYSWEGGMDCAITWSMSAGGSERVGLQPRDSRSPDSVRTTSPTCCCKAPHIIWRESTEICGYILYYEAVYREIYERDNCTAKQTVCNLSASSLTFKHLFLDHSSIGHWGVWAPPTPTSPPLILSPSHGSGTGTLNKTSVARQAYPAY